MGHVSTCIVSYRYERRFGHVFVTELAYFCVSVTNFVTEIVNSEVRGSIDHTCYEKRNGFRAQQGQSDVFPEHGTR